MMKILFVLFALSIHEQIYNGSYTFLIVRFLLQSSARVTKIDYRCPLSYPSYWQGWQVRYYLLGTRGRQLCGECTSLGYGLDAIVCLVSRLKSH